MMKPATSLIVALIGCLLAPDLIQARWDSQQDNKPLSTLESMTDKDLVNEAFDVCVRRAIIERQAIDAPDIVGAASADASDYLGLIYQVAGKNHGGVAPSWMLELTAAHTVKKCQSAFRTFLTTQSQHQAPEPRKETTPRVAKKTAQRRNADSLEQLPPWLVPPQK